MEKYAVQEKIQVGFQAFVSDGGEEFGAVRQVSPGGRPELVIYVENAGEFTVPLSAVDSVHSEKVVLNCGAALLSATVAAGRLTVTRVGFPGVGAGSGFRVKI